MSEFIRPDVYYTVSIDDGELHIAPDSDFMHRFNHRMFPEGQLHMLKYWNTDTDPPGMCNVYMPNDSARGLIKLCKLDVVERTFMSDQEHQLYIDWMSRRNLGSLDFDI